MHLVTWQNGVIADLGNEGNYFANVLDMNEAGLILAGTGVSGSGDRGVLWNGTSLVDLGTLGGTSTSPSRINEAGKIVATSRNAAGQNRAASWEAGSLVDLGTLPGGTESFGAGINDQGQLTGTSFISPGLTHGFLIDDGVNATTSTICSRRARSRSRAPGDLRFRAHHRWRHERPDGPARPRHTTDCRL